MRSAPPLASAVSRMWRKAASRSRPLLASTSANARRTSAMFACRHGEEREKAIERGRGERD